MSKTNTSKSKNTTIEKKDNKNQSEDLDGDLEKKEDATNTAYEAREDKETQKIKIRINKSNKDQRNNVTTDEPSKPEEVMNDKDEHKENKASIPDNREVKRGKTESEKLQTRNQDENINNEMGDTSNPENEETTNEIINLNNTVEEEESNSNEEKLATARCTSEHEQEMTKHKITKDDKPNDTVKPSNKSNNQNQSNETNMKTDNHDPLHLSQIISTIFTIAFIHANMQQSIMWKHMQGKSINYGTNQTPLIFGL